MTADRYRRSLPDSALVACDVAGEAAAGPDVRPAAAADSALIRCAAVTRSFGAGPGMVRALQGVDCAVSAGDRIALVGRSGSGKSTLLHLLAGLDAPDAGELSWPALGGAPRDPVRIGLVFQTPSLIASLSVVENVELPLLLTAGAGSAGRSDSHGRSTVQVQVQVQVQERAREALQLLQLAELADALPQELSGGQAQRAAIARVLACRPRVVLADEPTSRLDRATAARTVEVLIGVADRIGAALVVATHDDMVGARLGQVWQMADGILDLPADASAAAAARSVQGRP